MRIEMDGSLKSWAVPKGPSLDPSDKRLAVMVEDHDLSYADFEGMIPEGMYGAGEVYIWDSGTYEITGGGLAKGRLDLTFKGRTMKGGFVLTRMTGKEHDWLLIKRKDAYAEAGFRIRTVKSQ